MRRRYLAFASLAVAVSLTIGLQPMGPARAQDQVTAPTATQLAAVDAAVTAAANGDKAALATFLAANPTLATVVGDVVATRLDANSAGAANIAVALVQTGNASLISGVMVAANINATAQATLATAVAQSGNASLAQAIVVAVQNSGNPAAANAMGALTVAAQQTGVTTQVALAITLPPPPAIPVPSPAQIVAGSLS